MYISLHEYNVVPCRLLTVFVFYVRRSVQTLAAMPLPVSLLTGPIVSLALVVKTVNFVPTVPLVGPRRRSVTLQSIAPGTLLIAQMIPGSRMDRTVPTTTPTASPALVSRMMHSVRRPSVSIHYTQMYM